MRLWTFQSPDFKLTSGTVKSQLSEYADQQNIMTAYAELHRRIGTNQIVWCHVRNPQGGDRPIGKVCYLLDVPRAEVVLVNAYIWNRILGIRCELPPSLKERLWSEGIRLYPHDVKGREQYRKQEEESWYNQEPPAGGWWTALFIDNPEAEGANALVKHPLNTKWILGSRNK